MTWGPSLRAIHPNVVVVVDVIERRVGSDVLGRRRRRTTTTTTALAPKAAATRSEQQPTVGVAIQDAKTVEEICRAANEVLLLEGEETAHFHEQDVHRQKNKSASVNGLKRLAKMTLCWCRDDVNMRRGIVRLIKGAGLDGTKTNRKKRASDGIDALRATASVLVALHAEDEDDDDTEELRNRVRTSSAREE